MKQNPFLQNACPPDWTKMTPDFAANAVSEAIDISRANLDAIKNVAEPDYENTVRALDRAAMQLNLVWTRLNHLQSVADSDALRAAIAESAPRVADFFASINLDDELYAKIKAFSLTPSAAELVGEKRRLLDETLLDFELNGAGLPEEKKSRLREIEAELSVKTQKFSENVLDDTKSFFLHIESSADLAGLPQTAVDVAAKKAAERGLGGWVFTLEQPSYVPFMTYADSDVLREKLWRASSRLASDGKYSNYGLMREILALRFEKSQILSHANFADLVLCRRMARDGNSALEFVENLYSKFKAPYDAEWKKLCGFASKEGLLPSDALMPPWRSGYAAEKLRRKNYGFDTEALRPYLPMDGVLRGMFEICRRIYGVSVVKSGLDNSAWDSTVGLYEMRRADGSMMGYFYTDFVPRKTKRAGAWMNLLSPADGETPSVGVIAGNLSEPVGDSPALLSIDDAETLFHEFGHLLHFFMMDSTEIGLRNVAWDFVELPSQIMENWCKDKSALDVFARHWKTDEPIDDELYSKFKAAQKFMGATAAMRQLSFAAIDLKIHINAREFLDSSDIEAKARKELEKYSQKYSEAVPTILPRFTHLFGDSVGYAAGYYSYKWAEVLDADAFTRFERDGIFNPDTGAEFADKILRVGNSVPPEKAFENFMGRAPDADALVRRAIDAADSELN